MRLHLPNLVLVSLCSIAIAVANIANANAVDQAFSKAEAASPNRVTTKINRSVYEDMGLSMRELQSKVDDGDRRVEERNSRSTGTAATSSSSSSTGSSSSRSTGSGSRSYVCEYKCTNAKLTGADKSSMTIRVRAASKSAAEDETIRHGKATCYQQTSRVWDTGSQRCREE